MGVDSKRWGERPEQSKLERIRDSLQRNQNVDFYQNEHNIDPPERGFVHAVTLYIAPQTPIIEASKLTRFANNLSDLKPTARAGASISNIIGGVPTFFHARVEFIENIGAIDIKTTKVPRILDETLGLSLDKFAEETARTSTLKRKILLKVFPHTKIAELAKRYEASDLDNEELRRLIYFTPLEAINSLTRGENPFEKFEHLL